MAQIYFYGILYTLLSKVYRRISRRAKAPYWGYMASIVVGSLVGADIFKSFRGSPDDIVNGAIFFALSGFSIAYFLVKPPPTERDILAKIVLRKQVEGMVESSVSGDSKMSTWQQILEAYDD